MGFKRIVIKITILFSLATIGTKLDGSGGFRLYDLSKVSQRYF